MRQSTASTVSDLHRGLDRLFIKRVYETSWLAIGGLTVWALSTDRLVWCGLLWAGYGVALLLWWSAERVCGQLTVQQKRWQTLVKMALLHHGKYVLVIGLLMLLFGRGGHDPIPFTIGLVVPMLVVAMKAISLQLVPAEAIAAPVYSRFREVSDGD